MTIPKIPMMKIIVHQNPTERASALSNKRSPNISKAKLENQLCMNYSVLIALMTVSDDSYNGTLLLLLLVSNKSGQQCKHY